MIVDCVDGTDESDCSKYTKKKKIIYANLRFRIISVVGSECMLLSGATCYIHTQ